MGTTYRWPLARAVLACSLGVSSAAGCGGDRPGDAPDLPAAAGAPALFREVTAEAGVDFVHSVVADGRYRIAEINGSGCAVFDADGDGRLDLLFASAGEGPGDGEPNRLYLRTPDGRFRDATREAGIGDRGFGTSFAVGDVDNDGDLDVHVGNWGEDALYVNHGGVFERRGADIGLGGPPRGLTASATFLDYDLDGFLDLFVCDYVVTLGIESEKTVDYLNPAAYPPARNRLYRNRGDGTFEDVTEHTLVGLAPATSLGVQAEDLDGDGWVDLYVANDGLANRVWLNQRDGTFRDAATELGLAYNLMGAAEASMGVAIGDVDGDGLRDIFVSHLSGETNTLYRRVGALAFQDASGPAGVGRVSVQLTGWGVALFDVELDGDLDLAITNGGVGRRRRDPTLRAAPDWTEYAQPRQLLLNDGTGRFTEREHALGEDVAVGRGLLAADLDDDGDLDLVTTEILGPARVFENVAPREGRWLRLRLLDPALHRDAYGARAVVTAGGRDFPGVVAATTSFASSGDPRIHFGLGDVTRVEGVHVTWPGGETERFDVPELDRDVVLVRGEGRR